MMGADKDPFLTINVLKNSFANREDLSFLVFGDTDMVDKEDIEFLSSRNCNFVKTKNNISSDDNPILIMKSKRDSSLRLAMEAVKSGKAQGIISSGNTGAMVVLGKLVLKTLKGIDRPAICGLMPAKEKNIVMLDMGANSDLTPQHMLQLAKMGAIFSNILFSVDNPSIKMLNIGHEDIKGNKLIKETRDLILQSSLKIGSFNGYIEPDKIIKGEADVVLADGFTGNIYIKTAESIASSVSSIFASVFKSNMLTKLCYKLFFESQLKRAKRQMDKDLSNGALLIGLKHICVKSHGSTNERGFKNAIDMAISVIRGGIQSKISDSISDNIK